jgi:hypothetical protein
MKILIGALGVSQTFFADKGCFRSFAFAAIHVFCCFLFVLALLFDIDMAWAIKKKHLIQQHQKLCPKSCKVGKM